MCACTASLAVGQVLITPGKTVLIPDGTAISAVTTETISSKTAQEDDPITFKVDEDVVIDGEVVISKGTILKGVVTNAKKSGFFGRGGELNVRVETTETVDKQKLKVRAAKAKEGSDKTGTTVALVVLFGPLGFLKKGKNAEIKEGTKITVYTDEEKTVQVLRP
jgi:two-component sensor histidine kinase